MCQELECDDDECSSDVGDQDGKIKTEFKFPPELFRTAEVIVDPEYDEGKQWNNLYFSNDFLLFVEVESIISSKHNLRNSSSNNSSFESNDSVGDIVSGVKIKSSTFIDGIVGKTLLIDNPRIRFF